MEGVGPGVGSYSGRLRASLLSEPERQCRVWMEL
jgi:hypothetical protein